MRFVVSTFNGLTEDVRSQFSKVVYNRVPNTTECRTQKYTKKLEHYLNNYLILFT